MIIIFIVLVVRNIMNQWMCVICVNFLRRTSLMKQKKIRWVNKMYHKWRNYRHSKEYLERIPCDLDDISTITEESTIFAMTKFLTDVRSLMEVTSHHVHCMTL